MTRTALLTFSVGPVHTFIAQARRVADLWTGSEVLSHLVRRALDAGCQRGAEPVFPAVDPELLPEAPKGLPNRFVCRVPEDRAGEIAREMDRAVRQEWDRLVEQATDKLSSKGLAPAAPLLEQAKVVFDLAWSWVPEEDGGYAEAARKGAEQWNAVRRFRPFAQCEQELEKCAVCGERTALPDGVREHVRERWAAVEEGAQDAGDKLEEGFFRFSQSRLCLVCATKRLYTMDEERRAHFSAFDRFQPDDERTYFALLAMDGDRMGEILNWPEEKLRHGLEAFHRAVSEALISFAEGLRGVRPWQLDTEALELGFGTEHRQGKSPQLIYAGGEDVMVLCDPRDAVSVARKIRQRYLKALKSVGEHLSDGRDLERFTLSGAILFAHSKYPAGLAFREVEDLLNHKAKDEAGRNALALRLVKRGGVPVETAFRWSETDGAGQDEAGQWVERFSFLVDRVNAGELTSKQTYALRKGEEILAQVFRDKPQHWQPWVRDRLRRNGATAEGSDAMAESIAPFFRTGRGAALRIVRFLGAEMGDGTERGEATP